MSDHVACGPCQVTTWGKGWVATVTPTLHAARCCWCGHHQLEWMRLGSDWIIEDGYVPTPLFCCHEANAEVFAEVFAE